MANVKTKTPTPLELAKLKSEQAKAEADAARDMPLKLTKDGMVKTDIESLPPDVQALLKNMQSQYAELENEATNAKMAEYGINVIEAPAPVNQMANAQVVEVKEEIELSPIDSYAGRTIKLFDGRIVEMAPPSLPHQLVIADMFADVKQMTYKQQQNEKMARIMQYVRSINGRQLPGVCATWSDVVNICRELGQLGTNAVLQAWLETWPDLDGTYWQDVKKNLL